MTIDIINTTVTNPTPIPPGTYTGKYCGDVVTIHTPKGTWNLRCRQKAPRCCPCTVTVDDGGQVSATFN